MAKCRICPNQCKGKAKYCSAECIVAGAAAKKEYVQVRLEKSTWEKLVTEARQVRARKRPDGTYYVPDFSLSQAIEDLIADREKHRERARRQHKRQPTENPPPATSPAESTQPKGS